MVKIRNYTPSDHERVADLYKQSSLYGGQYDEARDSANRLSALVAKKPEAILVAEVEGDILGTVTLFEDGRSAWLYRFAVVDNQLQDEVVKALHVKATEILKDWGHTQVLVYAPVGEDSLKKRYMSLGLNQGDDFTAYWQNL